MSRGCRARLLEHSRVGPEHGGPKLQHDVVLFRRLQMEEPAESVEKEALDGHNRQGVATSPPR